MTQTVALVLTACLSGCEPAEAPDIMVQSVTRFSAVLDESSALAFHDSVLWSLNDSGNDPVLFGLSESGELLAKVTVLNSRNTDWESLAQDEDYLYIADTGNNLNSRSEFSIYRVPIPTLEQDSRTHVSYGTCTWSQYPFLHFRTPPKARSRLRVSAGAELFAPRVATRGPSRATESTFRSRSGRSTASRRVQRNACQDAKQIKKQKTKT